MMHARTMGSLAVLSLALLANSGCQPSAPAGLSDADRASLKEMAQTVMKTVNAKDYAAWAATFTDDAEWLPPNAPAVKGRAAIQAYVAGGPVMSDLALTQVDVDGRGDLAYVRGNYTLNILLPGASAPMPDKGKYFEIWRRQADGSWKNSRVMFNSDIPLPAPPPSKPAKK